MDVIQSSEIDCQDIGAGVTRWRLPDGVGWMGPSHGDPNLYERETWRQILEMCTTNMVSPTIRGNRGLAIGHVPGIGKSMFLNRLLIEFYRRFPEKSVLYYDRSFSEFIQFHWHSGKVVPIGITDAENLIKNADEKEKFVVFDDPSLSNRGPSAHGPTYFAAVSGKAMRDRKFREDRKQAGCVQVTMDPFTEEEAVVVLREIEGVPEEISRELYYEWGGNLRHLIEAFLKSLLYYEHKNERDYAFLKSKIVQQDGVENSELIGMLGNHEFPSHYIFHECRSDPNNPQTLEYRPASKSVAHRLHDSLQRRGPGQLAEFINSLNPACPQYWWAHEDLAHVSLASGGKFDLLSPLSDDFTKMEIKQLLPFMHEFVSECSVFPFDFTQKEAKKLFDTPPDSAKEAQQNWENTTTRKRQSMFTSGIEACLKMKNASREHAHTFVHARQNSVSVSLPKMVTVRVKDIDDMQLAIREWTDIDTNPDKPPRYFKPVDHNFSGIVIYSLTHSLSDMYIYMVRGIRVKGEVCTGRECVFTSYTHAHTHARMHT